MTTSHPMAVTGRRQRAFDPFAMRRRSHAQAGLTLIELMVALALGVLITLAAAMALVVSRQGFTSVDSAAQLRENARFSAELIQRVAVQAGYDNRFQTAGAVNLGVQAGPPGLDGYDNAWVTLAGLPAGITNGSRPSAPCGATDTSCRNGSDVLLINYSGSPDGTMINCAGIAETAPVRSTSIFHVTRAADGEPTLSCTYLNGLVWTTVELVKGVEGLQILYGMDAPGSPNTAPPAGNTCMDSVPDRYFTAAQMVAPSAAGTADNWRRVRALRIGMLFRGEPASAQVREAGTWNVLGDDVVNAADVGVNLVTSADGRLRHRLVFTVHLRNSQGYEACIPTAKQPCPQNAAC